MHKKVDYILTKKLNNTSTQSSQRHKNYLT